MTMPAHQGSAVRPGAGESLATLRARLIGSERAAIFWSLAAMSAAYFYASMTCSAADCFGMDETLAVFAARQSTLPGVWQAIWSGTDFSPPTYHFLLHGFITAFAAEHSRLAWRLAVYGAAWCTFFLIARSQLSRAAAVLGFGMVLALGLFDYAIQVRQYALLALGLAAALLCWSGFDEARSPKARACLLWLVLSACLSLHFYGFVEVVAIGTAELAYALSRRRVRIAVWCALLLTIPVEAVLYPLASHLAAFLRDESLAPKYYGRPNLETFLNAVFQIIEGAGFGLVLLIAAVLTIGVAHLRKRADRRAPPPVPAGSAGLPELHVVMIALSLLPLAAFAFSLFVTHSFSDRYMAGAALLPAIVIPYAMERLAPRRSASLTLVPLIVLILLLRPFTPDRIAEALAVLKTAKPPLAIVVGEGRLYIELMEAAEPSTRSRLVYLTRPEGLLSPDPTNENVVVRLAGLRSDYRVEDTSSFLGAHQDFYVLTRRKVSIDTTTPLLAERGLLGPPLLAEHGIQLFRAAAGDPRFAARENVGLAPARPAENPPVSR